MARLHFQHDDRTLLVQPLRQGRVVVGRSDQADIAIPSESVSRIHCFFDRGTEGWWVVDRSANGTRVNGTPISRHLLAPGDLVTIGDFTARFEWADDEGQRAPTAKVPRTTHADDEILDVSDDAMAVLRAHIRFVRGTQEGQTTVLQRSRSSLGGRGAHVFLDAGLPRAAAWVRCVRGRVMVEPGEAATFLAGVRVREITPVLAGEEVRVGDHGFVIESQTAVEEPEGATFGEMVGQTPVMRRVFGLLERVATSEAVVLLTGESGTGKELAARGIHDASHREDGPFVAVNCAAVADALFESELFGHERGAFTGATARRDGAFHQAHGGTLFLDEVGELRPEVQAKLLRALESGEVRRLGSTAAEFPDVRIVAATNRDLVQLVQHGHFRSDLYFRLAVLTVRLPALRDRRADVAAIAHRILERQHPGASLLPDAVAALEAHGWPGNVRELRNVLTRAVVLGGPRIGGRQLTFDPWLLAETSRPTERAPRLPEEEDKRRVVEALAQSDGNRTHAARSLGIPRSSLLYKMQRFGITTA